MSDLKKRTQHLLNNYFNTFNKVRNYISMFKLNNNINSKILDECLFLYNKDRPSNLNHYDVFIDLERHQNIRLDCRLYFNTREMIYPYRVVNSLNNEQIYLINLVRNLNVLNSNEELLINFTNKEDDLISICSKYYTEKDYKRYIKNSLLSEELIIQLPDLNVESYLLINLLEDVIDSYRNEVIKFLDFADREIKNKKR